MCGQGAGEGDDTEDGSSFDIFPYSFLRSRSDALTDGGGVREFEISRRDTGRFPSSDAHPPIGKYRSRQVLASLIIFVIKWCF